MPYLLPRVEPNDGFGESSCDSGDYASAFDRCVGEARWADKARLQGKLIDGRYHGLGIACFIEGGGSGPRENARIELLGDGSVAVYSMKRRKRLAHLASPRSNTTRVRMLCSMSPAWRRG